jgi:hypothetical protein
MEGNSVVLQDNEGAAKARGFTVRHRISKATTTNDTYFTMTQDVFHIDRIYGTRILLEPLVSILLEPPSISYKMTHIANHITA